MHPKLPKSISISSNFLLFARNFRSFFFKLRRRKTCIKSSECTNTLTHCAVHRNVAYARSRLYILSVCLSVNANTNAYVCFNITFSLNLNGSMPSFQCQYGMERAFFIFAIPFILSVVINNTVHICNPSWGCVWIDDSTFLLYFFILLCHSKCLFHWACSADRMDCGLFPVQCLSSNRVRGITVSYYLLINNSLYSCFEACFDTQVNFG